MSLATPDLTMDKTPEMVLLATTINTCRRAVTNFDRLGHGNAGSIHDVLSAIRANAACYSDDFDLLGELFDEMTTKDVPDMIELLREYVSMFAELFPAAAATLR